MMTRKSAYKKKTVAAVITAMLCIAVFVFYAFGDNIKQRKHVSADSSGEDYVKIIDVGQGDGILIHSNGYCAVIDTGTTQSANDMCASLSESGIDNIDVLMITHLHTDHTGGIRRIMEDYKVKNLILPELSTFSDGLYAVQFAINKVSNEGGGVYNAIQGMNFNIGDFEITVLGCYSDMKDENDRSIIAMAKIDGVKFLFTGDSGFAAEKALISDKIDFKCDVLKAGHHGSSTSGSKSFLDIANPMYAAISAGAGNSYGHPHTETVEAFNKRGIKMYRTDKSGDITFYVENGKINPQTEK